MLGSSFSVAGPNIVLNTIVADALKEFADELENAEDFEYALGKLIRRTLRAHKRIIFNGNNYSAEWVKEAEARGLLNLKSTVEALAPYTLPQNIALFGRHGVFSEKEIHSRYEILLESYHKVIGIEAETTNMLARRRILPAASAYTGSFARDIASKKALGAATGVEERQLEKAMALTDALYAKTDALALALEGNTAPGHVARAEYCRDTLVPAMRVLREAADALEAITPENVWPLPSYARLLFEV